MQNFDIAPMPLYGRSWYRELGRMSMGHPDLDLDGADGTIPRQNAEDWLVQSGRYAFVDDLGQNCVATVIGVGCVQERGIYYVLEHTLSKTKVMIKRELCRYTRKLEYGNIVPFFEDNNPDAWHMNGPRTEFQAGSNDPDSNLQADSPQDSDTPEYYDNTLSLEPYPCVMCRLTLKVIFGDQWPTIWALGFPGWS